MDTHAPRPEGPGRTGRAALDSAPLSARNAFRSLRLPIPHSEEESAFNHLMQSCRGINISLADLATWLIEQAAIWTDTGAPTAQFRKLVSGVLESCQAASIGVSGKAYFELYQELITEYPLNHTKVLSILSHLDLVAELSTRPEMTSSRLASVISSYDPRLDIGWRPLEKAIRKVAGARKLDVSSVRHVLERDKQSALLAFADSDVSDCVQLVSEAAARLGFEPDLEHCLHVLHPDRGEVHFPYLQILHYQCLIAEFFDAGASIAYEFAPRGDAAEALFSQYPQTAANAGNPFLNNAKSVERFSPEWARSKKPRERPAAHALVTVLSGLEHMGFPARRELCARLRWFLVRILVGRQSKLTPWRQKY